MVYGGRILGVSALCAGWLLTGIALFPAACRKPIRVVSSATPPASPTFSHQTHFRLKADLFCDACHQVDPKQMYAVARPGHDQHKPCTECHAEAFRQAPGPLCRVCHVSVNPRKKGDSPLETYPAVLRRRRLVLPFNHEKHLDAENPQTGLDCAACHALDPARSPYMSFPRHEVCAACHGTEGRPPAPSMGDCQSCHARSRVTPGRRALQSDIRFTHAKHQRTRNGEAIECLTCHGGVAESETVADLSLPEMKDCATCHEDAARTPDAVRIAKCEVCHIEDVAAAPLPESHRAARIAGTGWPDALDLAGSSDPVLASLAPAFVLPLEESLALMQQRLQEQRVEARVAPGDVSAPPPLLSSRRRPEDHTASFRVRHAAAASSENAKCRYCHAGLSGAPVSSCQDCHAVMRPRSHTARFRAIRHGRLAAVDARPCATCHEVDYCTGCHNIPPPSHFPLARFRTQHSRRASANARSCLTCHTGDATCFRCHQSEIR